MVRAVLQQWLPIAGRRAGSNQMKTGRGSQPAFEFAGPGHLRQLLFDPAGLVVTGKRDQIEILENASVPPGGQSSIFAAHALGINPYAIFTNRGGAQLIEHGQFERIRQIALPFELAEKFLHDVARDDQHNDRLHVPAGMREDIDAPDDLRDGNGRKFLQLEFDHRESLFEIAERELRDAQENVLGRKPGDIQFALNERAPVFGHDAAWQRFSRRSGLLAIENEAAVAGIELPELSRLDFSLEDVAGLNATFLLG